MKSTPGRMSIHSFMTQEVLELTTEVASCKTGVMIHSPLS